MKTWGEMSDEEQGELLLAQHRGKAIEDLTAAGKWVPMDGQRFHDTRAYRVKKEPVVDVRKDAVTIGNGLAQFMAWAECTYTDGKLTKIHWEADQ
jgi:hypothetical protein